MATFTASISNRITILGPAETNLWNTLEWGTDNWGSTKDMLLGVFKQVDESLTSTVGINQNVFKNLSSETLTSTDTYALSTTFNITLSTQAVSSTMAVALARYDSGGKFIYVRAEDQGVDGFSRISDGTNGWSKTADTNDNWSSL